MVTTTLESRTHPLHWVPMLIAGVSLGLFLGFAVGLARPHARR